MEVKVPNIGDFKDVSVINVLVAVGDTVSMEDPLIELESDKATMEVPSPAAGKIKEIAVKVGDRVSEGSLILVFEAANTTLKLPAKPPSAPSAIAPSGLRKAEHHAEVVVLGAGPGGYTAAFRAADLGKKVVLIDRNPTLGGVCLNVGCIPSKALLHAAKLITECQEMTDCGVQFGKPHLDVGKLRGWKEGIVRKLTGGLTGLAKARNVTVMHGHGSFEDANNLTVQTADGAKTVSFDQCIIAVGSEPITLPFVPHSNPRVMDSTGALALEDVPHRLLVLGAGIIGLEMATVYDALGSRVTVVELLDQIIPGADKDIVRPLHARILKRYENILLKTRVTAVEPQKKGLSVTFENEKGEQSRDTFDRILVAVGRKPNGSRICADRAGVFVDERGFIPVDRQQRTNARHIFAIGDVVGQPMLAHKAVHEGKVAAEAASGSNRHFDARVIPSVAYTDPEVAWAGLTEVQAKVAGRKFGIGSFPWGASGRSLSLGRSEGVTKLLFDAVDQRVIGAGIVGPNAGELIAEVALAIEMGADAKDLGHTIHPHPTLSETVNFAAEMFEGTITDLMPPKRK